MILIKELQQSESKALISLLNEHFKENGGKEENEKKLKKRALSCLQAMENTKELTLLVAIEPNATAVGYILIHWLKALWTDYPEAFITSFFVRYNWRLKGVGSCLLEAAIQEAKKRACVRLFLENNRDNPIYQKNYYAKRGWKERIDISIFEFPLEKNSF
ncbi:GNAT family N-acetyltransferase [Parachlamydia sp. AcF125]|uniref:GNAT family N-acetyltransferase n=1 Tax=Parachlamydia sp. AcF125 TaxID=2795736 RepID=UPI001BCA2531|nr:GNAT family N-acetyltransferase [Parachlamydia sp. AcF125]MBS4169174.1 hypothetical protein [Parachlamydia sp. AcF125]